MSIEGHATIEGTTRYRERMQGESVAANHFRLEQNLWLSSLGIGTYLGKPDAATDARYTEAVTRAVELGANVVDTAANYRFQRSERSIGAALSGLIESGSGGSATVARDEIVVCTKGGYIPFDTNPPAGQEGVRRYIEETFIKPGIADAADIAGGSHCMTPKYLAHQIDQSLGNMNLSAIDVYYIHNPESQLGVVSPAEFETRLRAAFEQLERSVAEGKIKNYGVATWNGFRVAPDARGYHSLERMVELAREVGGDAHGFRFIQLPFNLAMPEALTLENQKDMKRLVHASRLSLGAAFVPGEYVLQVVVTDLLAKEKQRVATQWLDFEVVK